MVVLTDFLYHLFLILSLFCVPLRENPDPGDFRQVVIGQTASVVFREQQDSNKELVLKPVAYREGIYPPPPHPSVRHWF